jgi:non-heme Fe2+,alpha-ketoglutarate-dependent halogenase
MLDYVGSLIGEDLLIHGTLMLCKFPGRAAAVPWHQDSVYSGWHLSPSVSAWIALSPSNEQSGCMRVIVGSQREGVRAHEERPDPSVLLKRGETVCEDVDESRARSVELQPGELSLHHANVIHGSRPNVSDQPRVGFIVRYVTSAYREGRGPVLRVRGRGDDRHLDLL